MDIDQWMEKISKGPIFLKENKILNDPKWTQTLVYDEDLAEEDPSVSYLK